MRKWGLEQSLMNGGKDFLPIPFKISSINWTRSPFSLSTRLPQGLLPFPHSCVQNKKFACDCVNMFNLSANTGGLSEFPVCQNL